MKAKYFLVGFLLLFTAIFSVMNTQAASYDIEVEEDDELIYTLNTLDEDAMEDIWGKDWDDDDFWDDAEVGAKMKIEIKDIEDGEPYWGFGDDSFKIEFDLWYFDKVDGDKFGNEDEDDQLVYVKEDPKDYTDLKPGRFSFIWPVDTEDYFDDVDWQKDVDQDGLTLAIEVEEDDVIWGATADEDCEATMVYNQNGVLQSAKLTYEDDQVVVEWSLGGGIPGYELPLLLGITAIFSIGIIYSIMKRQ